MGARHNERGIVLLVVLVVVTLLTIIVTEFTYSVQVDQHRARNAMHALQATVLARSGVNIAESFIALDDPPGENKYDSRNDEWNLLMQEFFSGEIQVGEGMRLRTRVEDESGKINVNNSRPAASRRQPAPGAQAQNNYEPDAFIRDAMRVIFSDYNIDLDIVDSLPEYWSREMREGTRVNYPKDFPSLEEFAAEFRIPTRKLNRLRTVLTALPVQHLPPQSKEKRININTASAEVLNALFANLEGGGGDAVQMVLERQAEDPPFETEADIDKVLGGIVQPEEIRGLKRVLGVESNTYRIRSSAVVNANLENEQSPGGIGQTVIALVRRKKSAKPLPDTGKHGWTFEVLDWQKEGGARLLNEPPDDEKSDESGAPSDFDEDQDDDEDF